MEKGTEIDLWFGIDAGCSVKVQGKYVGPNKEGIPSGPDRIDAEVTDPDHLDMIGWEPEDGPRIVSAHRLDDSQWVYYDDFGWSPKGEVSDEDLVEGELVGKDSMNNNDTFRYIKITQEFSSIFK